MTHIRAATLHAHWMTGVFLRIGPLNLLHGEPTIFGRSDGPRGPGDRAGHFGGPSEDLGGATGKVHNGHFGNLALWS